MPPSMRRYKMKKPPTSTLPPISPHILAIEASANQLSIAVMVDGEVVAARQHLAAHVTLSVLFPCRLKR